jgi:hypothetical protein
MTRLTGEFQTDLPLPDALAACAEAIHGLGWRLKSVEGRRIVSYTDSGSAHDSPRIEIEFDDSDQTTTIRIVGSDTDANPLSQDELIPELDRARDAIKASVGDATAISADGPPVDQSTPPRRAAPSPSPLRRDPPQARPHKEADRPAFTAPTKVCPHCGAQAQTTESKCPNCGKQYKRRTGLRVFMWIVLGGLVLLVGCSVIIGLGVEEAGKEAQKHAITKAQFDSIKQETSQATVEQRLGVPEDSQEFEQQGVFTKKPQGSSCIYYNEKGKELFEGNFFQFCFTGGKLDGKNAY